MNKGYCETGNSHLVPNALLLLTFQFVYDTGASGRKEMRVIYWKKPKFGFLGIKLVKALADEEKNVVFQSPGNFFA